MGFLDGNEVFPQREENRSTATNDRDQTDSLVSGVWLSDNIMSAYANKLNTDPPDSDTYILANGMVQMLCNHQMKMDDLPEDARAAKYLVCLIYDLQRRDRHWMVLRVNIKQRPFEVAYYNSMRDPSNDTYETAARKAALDIVSSLKGAPDKPLQFNVMPTPQQIHDSECGLIALGVVKALKRGEERIASCSTIGAELQEMFKAG